MALKKGHIDVLFRNTSATIGREIDHSIVFGPTTFYDRQAFLISSELDVQKVADLKELEDKIRICVTKGTTTQDNLAIFKEKYQVDFEEVTETSSGESIQDTTKMAGSLITGHCDIITGDFSQIATLIKNEESQYKFLDVDLSKELLSPVTISGDLEWSNIIRYVTYATIEAAELEIGKQNLKNFDNDKIDQLSSYEKNFLGLGGDENIAERIGLRVDFVKNIVSHVGNYDDIYESNLLRWPSFRKRGLNQVAGRCDEDHEPAGQSDANGKSGSCGLLISLPFTAPETNPASNN